ncbi:MAG: bifunctional adenosylcobinamide kinase/adenosylcobinamide-phosphate guanylyltransferase [Jatrophihabitantaceae bacterium]
MTESGRRVLVLGGARSGKSAHAEALLADEDAVDYIGTVESDDDDAEWAERIARHREHRPEHWRPVEAGQVAEVFAAGVGAVLLDSISDWLAALLEQVGLWSGEPDAKDRLAGEVDRLVGAWAATERLVVAVSDEVGSGLAPEVGPQRLFRDVLGLLNQRLAASSDEVWLVTAGVAQRLR